MKITSILQEKRFKKLRSRAEKILATTHVQQNDSLNKECIHELIKELILYQIELELQNEELCKLQMELKESRKRYTELLDFVPIGYFILADDGVIRDVSQPGAKLLGVSKQTLINKNLLRYISMDSFITYANYFSQLSSSGIKTCEAKILKKSGSIFDAQLSGKMMVNPRTLNREILLMVTDLTSNKRAETQTCPNRQKMTYIDGMNSLELVSVMAHEINQPLAAISNYIHGSIFRLEQGNIGFSLLLQIMQKIAEQLQRVFDVMLRMRNFIYKGEINYEPVCVDLLMQESLKLINDEMLGYPAKIKYRATINPPIVMMDKIQIQQVILNLVRNSIDAMKDNQTVEPVIIIELNKMSKNQIEITILDNGPGVPAKIAHKLFDPYFTTKAYGVGLGLAISRAIIEAHDGKLVAELNTVYGACFKIILPVKPCE